MNDIRFKTYYKDKWYLVPKIDMWSYGIDEFGMVAPLIRMNDKLERLKNRSRCLYE